MFNIRSGLPRSIRILPTPKKRTRTVITSADRVIDLLHSAFGETKDGRDECPRMADSDEEDEVGDIDAPEDRPCKSGHTQSMAILIKVGPYRPEDDGDEDGEGEIKGLSCLSDGLEQNGILFQSQTLFLPSHSL